jgi:hypothetical protein
MASLIDYKESQAISASDPSFAAIIFAACRKADDRNLESLEQAFPHLVGEFRQRYNAPGGALNEQEMSWLNNAT